MARARPAVPPETSLSAPVKAGGDALRRAPGPLSLRAMRATGDVPNPGHIVRDNVDGWFERVDRGVSTLTPRGVAARQEPGETTTAAAAAHPRI